LRKETVDWEKAKCLYRQGYSYKRISKIMGVSVQTLKNSYWIRYHANRFFRDLDEAIEAIVKEKE